MDAGFDFKQLFDTLPGILAVLAPDDPKFTILAATDEFLAVIQKGREGIAGQSISDVFDHNADPAAKSENKIRSSLQRVMNNRSPDYMGIIERNVRRSQTQGTGFETRFWDITNSPLMGTEGKVACIVHHIEDVTRLELQRRKLADLEPTIVALRDARHAALNLMEDAIDARRHADEVNEKLRQEILAHQEAEKEILALARFPMKNPNPVLQVSSESVLMYANQASAPVLALWQISKGEKLPADITLVLNKTLASGKPRQIELNCGDRIYDFVFAPVPEEGCVNLYARDITSRKHGEARILRLTDIHTILSKVNEAIVRTYDKQDLFDEICRIIAENGHYPLVWIGEVRDNRVVPMSVSGPELEYLNDIRVEVTGELGQGPTGTAIRENRAVINYNFDSNPAMSPWRVKAQKYRLASSAAFPLQTEGKATGVITVYGSENDAFDAETTALFESLSADISYALDSLRDEVLRAEADAALRRNQQTFVNLVEGAPFGIYVVDSQFRLTQMNQSAQTKAFRNVQPAIGRDFNEAMRILWTEPVAAEIVSHFRHTLETCEPFYAPRFTNMRNDVEVVESYEWELHRITLADGQYGVICYYFDSTELRHSGEALRQSYEKLRLHIENSPLAVIEWDAAFVVTRWEGAAENMLGWSSAETVGKPIANLNMIYEADIPVVEKTMARLTDGVSRQVVSSNRNYTKDGRVIYCTWYNSVLYDNNGKMVSVMSQVENFTDRNKADEALRRSEERYRGLVEQTFDGIFVADKQGRYIDVNTAGAAMLGYAPQELLKLTLADVLAPEELSRLPGQLSDLATGAMVRNEWQFRRKDGTTFTGELIGQYLPDGRLQGILRDTTERKSAEIALQLSEQRLRLAQEAARAGSWEWDLLTNGNIWSDETFIVYGLEPGSVEPSFEAWLRTIHPNDREKVAREVQEAAAAGLELQTEWRVVDRDGSIRWVMSRGRPIADNSGKPTRYLGIVFDITERKKIEKLKDEFIGMISHELKTPITVVIGALSTAAMKGISEKVKAELFHDAVNHADILASIIDNLLELSRQQSNRLDLRKKPTDIGEIACKVTDVLKRRSTLHDLKCDFPEGLPKVPADPLRIERIMYNLVENAIKYSPAGGEIRVFGEVTGGSLRVGVSDHGIGISAENQPRLFQPFERLGYEVKGAIQGTGLGLRVCRILTEAHSGQIWVESTLGKGSTFYFTLPLVNDGK